MNKSCSVFFIILMMAELLACNNSKSTQNQEKVINTDIKKQISDKLDSKDQAIFDEYNKSTELAMTGDLGAFHKELAELLPKVKTMKNEKKRNFILGNIYFHLEMYQDALALNEEILSKKPTASKQEYKCILLRKINSPQKEIQSCYELTAKMIKKVIDLPTTQADKNYPYVLWSYYSAMNKAGHTEYRDCMKKLIDSTSDEIVKGRLEDAYNEELRY